MKRIIGKYSGQERGPLLFVFGAMHGNESAGVKAMDLMMKMLEVEPITNPAFSYKGRVIALTGNMEALKQKKRYIDRDLNRCWTPENAVKALRGATDFSELQEMRAILGLVHKEIKSYQPDKVYVLDLHTTSSAGGIFTVVPEHAESIRVAIELQAPVITNMTKGLVGTSIQFFTREQLGVETVCLSFESGQHDDPLSINRAIAAVTNCMKIIGSIDGRHIENRHNYLLTEYSKRLPKLCRLIMKHEIRPFDQFIMEPGYSNFREIRKGEILGHDINGPVRASHDGLILMPLYQKQGDEGYFLIEVMDL